MRRVSRLSRQRRMVLWHRSRELTVWISRRRSEAGCLKAYKRGFEGVNVFGLGGRRRSKHGG